MAEIQAGNASASSRLAEALSDECIYTNLPICLAYDSHLVRDVLGIFIRAVFASLRRRARAYAGIRKGQCGAVTFVQRFGGAANLNVHFHSLVLDGVYYANDRKRLRFRRLPPPGDA